MNDDTKNIDAGRQDGPGDEVRVRGYLAAYAAKEPRAREILQKLTGFGSEGVRRWFNDGKVKRTPGGLVRIIVLFHLRSAGIEPKEFAGLAPELLEFGDRLAKLGSLKEALRQATKILEAKQSLCSQLFQNKATLTAGQRVRISKYLAGGVYSVPGPIAPSPVAVPHATAYAADIKSVIIEAFSNSLESMRQLATVILSDQFSDEERARMREITEKRVSVYKALDTLRALTSPMSRQKFIEEQKGTQQ